MATVAVCPLYFVRASYQASACGGMMAGALRSKGVGFDASNVDESLALDALAHGRFALHLAGPLWGALSLAFAVPHARSELSYTTPDGADHEIFRASLVAATGELGLALHFP